MLTSDIELLRELGRRLRNARKASKYSTQEQACKKIGITRSTLISYEHGKVDIPITTLIRMCDAYGITIEKLTKGMQDALVGGIEIAEVSTYMMKMEIKERKLIVAIVKAIAMFFK